MPAEQFNSTMGAPAAPTIPVVTLAAAYANGASAADSTLTIDATRAGFVVTASGLAATVIPATVSHTLAPAAGAAASFVVSGNFAPASGTATYVPVSVSYTVNQTGGANGTVTGLKVAATETALVGTHLLADFQVGGASKFTVTNGGRLGLGTAAPEGGISIGAQALNLSTTFGAQYTPWLLSIANSDTNSFPGAVFGFSSSSQMRFYWSSGGGQLSSVGASIDLAPATALTFYTTTGGRITSAGHWLVGNTGDTNSKMRVLGTNTQAATGALTWNAFEVMTSTFTLTGTTTVTGPLSLVNFVGPTITDASSVTVTQAATLNITAAPTAGGSVTLTETYALLVQAGNARFGGNVGIGVKPTSSLHVSAANPEALFKSTSTSQTADILLQNSGSTATLMTAVYGSAVAGTVFGVNFASACAVFSTAGTAPLVIGTLVASSIVFGTNNAAGARLEIDSAGNVILGSAALATNATDGFLYVDTCAGTPTGVPTGKTGRTALVYDTTNNKLAIYNGAWKQTAALA